MNRTKQQWITVLAVVATITVNLAANALPLNNVTTKELSDGIMTFFVPAGYVFSIWGIIYLGLGLFGFYQANLQKKHLSWLMPVYSWFWLSCIANMGWIFLWHYRQVELSVFAMLVLLVSLMMVYRGLEIGAYPVSSKTKWMVHIPMSIYLGWISVATIANISAALYVQGWDGFGLEPQVWSAIMILVAALLSVVMLVRNKDIAFAGVVIWALVGIWYNFPTEGVVVMGAVAGIAIIVIALLKTALDIYQESPDLSKKSKKK